MNKLQNTIVVIGIVLAFALLGQRCFAAPFEETSYKIADVASTIKDPAGCRMVLLGDSTATVSQDPRWGVSITNTWDLPFAGRTFYTPTSQSLANGFIEFGTATNAAPGDTLDGITVPEGFQAARWKTWASDADFTSTYRAHGNLDNFKQGHPLASQTYQAHWAMLGTNNPQLKCFVKYADSANATEVDLGAFTYGVVADGTWQKVSFGTYSGDATDRTSLGPSPITHTDDETGQYLVVGGWQWEAVGKAGLHLSEIAVGGYRAFDHQPVTDNAASIYSVAERKTKFDLFGWPNVIAIQLGINDTDPIRTTFKTQITNILNWHTALYSTNSKPAPKFLLIVPWDTDGTAPGATKRDDIAKVHTELADERTDVGVLNLYRKMTEIHGHYDDWNVTFLADGIHQNQAGALEFGVQSWAEINDDPPPTYEQLMASASGVYLMQDNAATTSVVNENGSPGTLVGAGNTSASIVPGPTLAPWLPLAIDVDGVDDYVDCGDHSVAEDGIFTYAIWYKSSSAAVTYVINEGSTSSNTPLTGLRLDATETRSWLRNDLNQGSNTIGAATTDGQWHFVVQVGDGMLNRLYIDGAFVQSVASPSVPITVNQTTLGALRRTSVSNYFVGSMAGAVFSDVAWSPTDVATVYAGPIPATATTRLLIPIRLPLRLGVR